MKAVVIKGPGNLEIVEKPVPTPGAGEVLVKIKYCGICGSDLHAFETGFLDPEITIGHEFSGIIEEVGDNCPGWSAGDPVTGNNIIGCGSCSSCMSSRDNLCREVRRLGITDHGTMAEYALFPAKDLVKISKQAPLEQLALTEPLSVALHAANRANTGNSDRVLIIGAGTIGLILLSLLKLKGIENVIVFETNPDRHTTALQMGASAVLDPGQKNLDRDIASLTENKGTNLVFECAGLPETIQEACSRAAAGGKAVILSICYQPAEISFLSLVTQEIDIITAFGKTGKEFKEAAEMIAEGLIDLSPLITGIIPLEKVADAFHNPSSSSIKTLVQF